MATKVRGHKTEIVEVRLTPHQLGKLEKLAILRDATISDVLREIVLCLRGNSRPRFTVGLAAKPALATGGGADLPSCSCPAPVLFAAVQGRKPTRTMAYGKGHAAAGNLVLLK
jgi:hypothetical protein